MVPAHVVQVHRRWCSVVPMVLGLVLGTLMIAAPLSAQRPVPAKPSLSAIGHVEGSVRRPRAAALLCARADSRARHTTVQLSPAQAALFVAVGKRYACAAIPHPSWDERARSHSGATY